MPKKSGGKPYGKGNVPMDAVMKTQKVADAKKKPKTGNKGQGKKGK